MSFDGDLKVNANFAHFSVKTDQSLKNGGEASAPDPFSLFLSSIATCAGFFAIRFCQSRDIATDGMEIKMTNDWNSSEKVVDNIQIQIKLPEHFPLNYTSALIRSIDQCTVKKTILHQPVITVTTGTVLEG